MTALDSLSVLEISNTLPVAWCGRQFVNWGADVATVEERWSPQHPEYKNADDSISLLHLSIHAGKTLIDQTSINNQLFQATDILITDLTTAELAQEYGLTTADIPIVVDISAYGRSGPYAEYASSALTVEAMSGFLSVQGHPDREPLRMPGHIMSYVTGVSAFNAAMAALFGYRRWGQFERIEVSMMEVLATIVPTLRTQIDQPEKRHGGPGKEPMGVRLYNIGGGHLSFNLALKPALGVLMEILGLQESDIPNELTSFEDRQDYDKLHQFVKSLDSPFDIDDLFTIISEPPHNSAVGKVKTPAQLITDPQLAALCYWQDLFHPVFGELKRPGPAARLPKTPAVTPGPPVRGRVDWRPSRPHKKNSPQQTKKYQTGGPLRGLCIVDLTQAWIGPYASQILSDLGAEVIKVESLHKPDVWRSLPPKIAPGVKNADAKLVNCSGNFNSVNRDKKSLTLDLTTDRGKTLFLKLVEQADIVMENYTPQVMSRFGLDYENLCKVRPNLIMASFCGYGQAGPYNNYRANGTTIEAIAGWDSLFGYADGPPMVMGFYQADAITGTQMAATTLAALAHRQQTGEGQHVQGSMFEAAVGYIEEYVLLGQHQPEPPRLGNRHPDYAPQGIYPCKGNDAWIAISITSEEEYQQLCRIRGMERLAPDLKGLKNRQLQHDNIDEVITRWSRTLTTWEATRCLQRHQIPSAPIQTTDQLVRDQHLAQRGWFHRLNHPDLGPARYAGFPWRFRNCTLESNSPSPRLGQHSRELLASRLQLDQIEIDELFNSGVSGEVY